jgi:FAD:protein FMN transferase
MLHEQFFATLRGYFHFAALMSLRTKNILYTVVLLSAMAAVWYYRKSQAAVLIQLQGETMATTYHVSYFDTANRNFQTSLDSLLKVVNKSINNYDSTSEVSRFNRSAEGLDISLPYLLPALKIAKQVFTASNGAFDMTVLPLVNAWGFGPDKKVSNDSTVIDSLKTFIGFEKISFTETRLSKTDGRTQLDFGGIGQGYGADVLADFLRGKGIENFLVELGGEGVAAGTNLATGNPWQIGILDPNSTREQQFFKAYAALRNKAFTTSGNYFNYKIVDGKKYSHTIDPSTGYPVSKALLSATVFAPTCTEADAWGTAFMVMGHEKAIELLAQHPELEVLLFYTAEDGTVASYVSESMRAAITIKP